MEIPLGEYISFEYLAISVHCKTTILITTVYRPPKSKCGFLEKISQLLSKVSIDYDCLIESGDFNIHFDTETDPDAINSLNLLEAFDLSQHVRGPTCNTGHTLDLIISKGLNITAHCVMDVAFSDHCCIYFDISAFSVQLNGF
ncbi:hypothetical protein ABVT39_019254 [Epinephelus coioides]